MNEIFAVLDRTANSHTWSDPDTVLGTLHYLLDEIGIRRLLMTARKDIQEVADRSYAHVNGFKKIVLQADNDGRFKLRLHVWPRLSSGRQRVEDAHNHRWPFASRILLGGYRFQEFRSDPQGERWYHFRYSPVGRDDNFQLEALGDQSLRVWMDLILQTGSEYYIDANVIHRVLRSDPDLTCSLMLQGPSLRESSDVFRIAQAKEGQDLQEYVGRLDAGELLETLDEVEENMSRIDQATNRRAGLTSSKD